MSAGMASRRPPPTISLICELMTRCTTAGLRMYSSVSESSSPWTSMISEPVPSIRSISSWRILTSVILCSRSCTVSRPRMPWRTRIRVEVSATT